MKNVSNGHIMKVQVNILARELYLEFVPMDLDSDGTSRDIDTAVFAQNFDTFHMGRVVWPAEPFLKKCPNVMKSFLFSKYTCPFFQEQVPKMSFSPCDHRQALAMGS